VPEEKIRGSRPLAVLKSPIGKPSRLRSQPKPPGDNQTGALRGRLVVLPH